MHTKRIGKLGRIVLPKDILDRFQLDNGDQIDISFNETQIIIEPHRQTYVCAITGKVSSEAVKIGEAWISKEGIKKLIEYMDQ
ncbi:AbrB/MazE/SpoVT family DNA-binding domain-containing protein [Paenisporosarcina macmurdoensis]|uniref:AbrB/MazE/SpoVT family DNA-binding domain-containing protein n=1 Tax=Paenisporosarcina macmurdoensis TaxID=212659 RepID=A0ABW1L5J6_9BACL